MTEITRRTLLSGAAAAAALVMTPVANMPARASAPASGKQVPGFYRYKVGDYEITALNDGVWNRDLEEGFVKNAPLADVQKALEEAFQPTNVVRIPFTALAVNTGSKLVLIDTGTGGRLVPTAGTYMDNLAAAGIEPKAVDTILISHFHPDHINGIRLKDERLAFPNAEIQVPASEWAFWMDDGKMSAASDALKSDFDNVRRVFGSIAKDVKQFEPGKEVAPGITSIAAPGHTPGHTAFAIASGNQSMMTTVDAAAGSSYLFVRRPEWQPIFDMDASTAVETRKHLLDRAAADKMLVAGYHWPFPATGYVTKDGLGYQLHALAWSSIP